MTTMTEHSYEIQGFQVANPTFNKPITLTIKLNEYGTMMWKGVRTGTSIAGIMQLAHVTESLVYLYR